MGAFTDLSAHQRHLLLLLGLVLKCSPVTWAQSNDNVPLSCGQEVDSLYYNLCDTAAIWGVVLEAFAAAGVVSCFVLVIVLVASVPFITEKKKKSTVGIQVGFLLSTMGLFGLTFDFIIKKNFATCASRHFLFGVLFAGCFSCLLAHCVQLNLLVRKDRGTRGWILGLGALALWLVEVIINTEWLILSLVRPSNSSSTPVDPCSIANMDFAMALIYVMVLLLAILVAGVPAQVGQYKRWKKHGVFILVTASFSAAIWVTWIVMYVYANRKLNKLSWDDPTLAIALVSNAWCFLLLYIIPELCFLTKDSQPQQNYSETLYTNRGVGYENILKEHSPANMFVENKAFSMDEPSSANKPVSPYSGYNGQLRGCVYQPTELAIISKGGGEHSDMQSEAILPRATMSTQLMGGTNSTIRAEDVYSETQPHSTSNGNTFYSKAHW